MNLTQNYLTKNDCYKAGRTITPKGIMIHSPGVAQPDVDVFVNTWNAPGVDACVHAFVTREGVVQTLPWNWRGWHAGTPPHGGVSANNTHISIEILEPTGHTYDGGRMVGYDPAANRAYFAAVYHNAVELCTMLCGRYGFNPADKAVLLCHSEGYARSIASNHADVMHWFPFHGKSMDAFRSDVAAAMAPPAPELDNTPAAWEREGVEWARERGILRGGDGGDLLLHQEMTTAKFCVMLKRFHDGEGK